MEINITIGGRSSGKSEYGQSGRGRPVKVLPRDHEFKMRMNAEEKALLDYLSEETNMSKTDVVIHALRFYKTLRFDKR